MTQNNNGIGIDLQPLIEALELEFKDPLLLSTALTHSSYVWAYCPGQGVQDNKHLEYIGDAVICLVVQEFLCDNHLEFPNRNLVFVGDIFRKNKMLGSVGKRLKLGHFLLLGNRTEEKKGRNDNDLNAKALKALIGAIYKDRGIATARIYIDHLILRHVNEWLKEADSGEEGGEHKS